jgi:hypothetical protein
VPEPRDDSTAANSSLGAGDVDDITDDMTAGSGGDDAPPPSYGEAMMNPHFLEGRARSDSDYARELHARLNLQN